MPTTEEKFIPGAIITLKTGEGKAKLVRRVLDGEGKPITFPTNSEHQLGSWEVELIEAAGFLALRAISEIGVNNKNRPEKINFDDFYTTPPSEVAEKKERIAERKAVKEQRKEKRAAMTENKAKSFIKAHHRGAVNANDPMFAQAVAFAVHQPWGAKYFKKYLPSMLVDPCNKQ